MNGVKKLLLSWAYAAGSVSQFGQVFASFFQKEALPSSPSIG
jgi:hypothetical protein